MDWTISILAAVAFYTRIVIKKLDGEQLNIFEIFDEYLKSLVRIMKNRFSTKNMKPGKHLRRKNVCRSKMSFFSTDKPTL